MADNAESSGDGCNPYSDDEDCYENGDTSKNNYGDNDDEDDDGGSGSGQSSNDYVPSSKNKGRGSSKTQVFFCLVLFLGTWRPRCSVSVRVELKIVFLAETYECIV
jgi:hypothetical protein